MRDGQQAELRVEADVDASRRIAETLEWERAQASDRETRLAAEREALREKLAAASAHG